jgi:hypothetical protein
MERNRLPRSYNPRLVAELQRQGRRVEWFCQQMGVSRWAFWRIESGRAGAPIDWYERAAAVLGVRVEDIAPEELAAA